MKTSEMLNYVNNDKSINILVAIEDYTEINNFINKVIEITDNFFKNNNTIINSMLRFNMQKNYYDEYITNNYVINFVDFVSEKLNNYCLKTIENYYFNIGFNQLLNPYTAELKPPQHTDFPQESAIQILNTLFREGNWELLNHISIISYDEIITTERIIRDPVDEFNFNLKKKYFTQLIRCRYTEVLKNYNTYISAIIQICRNELNDRNLDGVIDYIIQFFDAVKDSKEMFTYMLLALDKLKATSIWEVMYNSHACLSQTYDLLSNLFPKIEQLNLTQSDFLNLSTDDMILIANNFLFNFQRARKQFDLKFTEGNIHFGQRCLFKEDFLSKNELLKSWQDIVLFYITYKITDSRKVLYEYSLNEFINFYKNAITSEYSCLGFNKINISN
ncbi:uncharacterized protein LOC126902314 isoform X4 [Daktulosphaira vitifoliae]|uniref:uncharacterized protein LOC126902314 isoform X2 n=1 Tax=Daktulosphaira vitifoliae TaxID=58002 RepID=UPI0021A98C9B|nr:uncharacterized protein LOC126902314 isoform X2 [Daktulosphaira vitifoliae]XP_050535610.1 uncharacterized protein LOC126902314 isoform X3 [Daktulosphaira vitifoliae]XP_050535695.1 uncharacterized protein LOC126902314 isoform X4 [Daktulosphaira vitifoliae]